MTCYVVGEHINPNELSAEALGNRSGKGISNVTNVLIYRTCTFFLCMLSKMCYTSKGLKGFSLFSERTVTLSHYEKILVKMGTNYKKENWVN